MVAIETGRPFRLGLAAKLVRSFGNMRELLSMTSAERVFLAGFGKALQSILTDRLEQEEALVPDWFEKVEVDERR